MNFAVQVSVDYKSDLQKVENITLEVAKQIMREVKGGVPEFLPAIFYDTFADSSIIFNVGLRVKEFADQKLIKHEFIKRLHQKFHEEKIVIPYPQRTLHISKEAQF